MDKDEALINLNWIGWLLIITSVLALINKIFYWYEAKSTFDLIAILFIWAGIGVSGLIILYFCKFLK